MAEITIDLKVKINEDAKNAYLLNLEKQIKSGKISEDEAIALIKVDYKQFVEVEVVR